MNKQQLAFQAKMRQKEYDEQLQAVKELELKARFWEAQWKIRFYTLEAESLQKPYDEYVAAQREKNQQAMQEYQEMLAQISKEQQKKAELIDHIVTEETLRLNPEMVEQGVKVGDLIQIPKHSDMTPEEETKAEEEFLKEHPEYAETTSN